MFKLAFRNIFRNRMRSALTLAAIITGVIAIILSGGFIEDVFVQLREATIHSRLGHLQIYRQGFLEFGRREPSRYLIPQPQSLSQEIADLPHVRDVMARVEFSGLANNGQADLPIIGEGVEPSKEERLGTATTLVAGRQLRDDDYTSVVVGEGVAASLNLRPDSHITLMVSTFEGALNTLDADVVGVFRTFFKDYDDRAIRIPMAAAQDLLYTQAAHVLVVALDDSQVTDSVLHELEAQIGPKGYTIKPWYTLANFYTKTVALYERQFGALQVIILVMLVLSVASTVNMAVYERTGEFGTLMAIGLRRRRLMRQILLEYTLLGVLGAFIGLVLGVVLALSISSIGITMPPPPGSNASYIASIRLTPRILMAAPLIGIIAASLATILPARRAARLPVVDALRQNI